MKQNGPLYITSQTFSDSCLFYLSSFGNEAVVLNGETLPYGHPVNTHTLLFHFILIQPNTHSATSYLKNPYNIDRFLWPISDQIVRFHCHSRGKVIEKKNFSGSSLCNEPLFAQNCMLLLVKALSGVMYNCC